MIGSGGAEVVPTSTIVAAAASVPSSFVSMKAWCRTLFIRRLISEIFEKSCHQL
jgi:hypothetical protein